MDVIRATVTVLKNVLLRIQVSIHLFGLISATTQDSHEIDTLYVQVLSSHIEM